MGITRRTMLKGLAGAGMIAAIPGWARGAKGWGSWREDWKERITKYLETLRRSDGGYGWEDQEEGHLTPTFAAIGCYRAMGMEVPERKKVAAFVRGHHPFRDKKPEQKLRIFDYQQIQGLLWLGEDVSEYREEVKTWTGPIHYMERYESHGWPVFGQETAGLMCRKLLGLGSTEAFDRYIAERKRGNGSYNNTIATDGTDGHVMNTWWGIWASGEKDGKVAEWLKKCRGKGGGFTYAPGATIGAVEDAGYTWAAVMALKQAGAGLDWKEGEGCMNFLGSVWNKDGGFGDRPGWGSNPVATWYAVEILAVLGETLTPTLSRSSGRGSENTGGLPVPLELGIYTIQIEAPGKGSVADAVEMARGLKIDLWGAKNAKKEWIAAAQREADRRKVPVKFFVADEEYGTFVTIPGMGSYSHLVDVIAPAGREMGPNLAGKQAVVWEEFRNRRVAPLEKAQGRLIWQFNENEELARMLLDDAVERGLGHAAISTFHFGNPDFTNSEPFLYRWRWKLPYIALQDNHANEPWWWGDQLTGFRTLFLAKEPTWEGWIEAMKNNRVVAVRKDDVTGGRLRMHGGAPGVQEIVKKREAEWRWWDPELRPAVSVVVVKPGDEFETPRPQKGAMVRIRCQWENTAQGLPKKPLVELVKVEVDGKAVEAKAAEKRNAKKVDDHFHAAWMPEIKPGKHTVTVTVRRVGTKTEMTQTVEFVTE